MPAPRRAKGLPNVAEDLAESLVRAVAEQRRAGSVLHDDIGPLLSAAGLRLQLLRMDFPDAVARVREVMEALEDAMERVRALSQQLNPSPVYRSGFKNAVADLVERHRQKFPGKITFTFATAARLPVEAAVAMYEAVTVALSEAADHADATHIDVSVRGTKTVKVCVKDNGTGRRSHRTLALAALLARQAGLTLEVSTGKGTIVWISYALRRTSRG
jgi:signal transduction histidine kinase